MPICHTKDLIVEHFDNTLYRALESYSASSTEPTLASAHHALTIDWAIWNRVNTDYLLLLDSDIIFKQSFKEYYVQFVQGHYALMGFRRDTYRMPTIAPWCCFINIKLMKQYNLRYFDINRILFVNGNTDYDTGASLLEDFEQRHCLVKTHPDNLYTIHLKCGSNNPQKHEQFILKNRQYL